MDRLSEPEKAEFRLQGRVLVEALLQYLDHGPDGDDDDLERAAAAAAGHGRLMARLGCSTVEAVETFLHKGIKHATVAVQGFGNVGSNTVASLLEMGAKVVAVSDVRGGARARSAEGFGISFEKMLQVSVDQGTVAKVPGAEEISNEELLEMDVDVLIPAAMENQITEKNAGSVRAKLVIEAANGPTTTHGDKILNRNGVTVVPDILANSGGVLVSYFEWVQNLNRDHWSVGVVNERLELKMKAAFGQVLALSRERNVDLRMGALAIAVEKVTAAMRLSGWH
jgi:glutamate dehydrogenase/leucine dehydrogenase